MPIWLDANYFFYQDNERTFAEARNRGVDILLTTPDPITKVADCYEVQLRKVGLEVAEGIVPPGGPASRVTLNGTGAGSGRKVTVIIQGGNRGAWVESIE